MPFLKRNMGSSQVFTNPAAVTVPAGMREISNCSYCGGNMLADHLYVMRVIGDPVPKLFLLPRNVVHNVPVNWLITTVLRVSPPLLEMPQDKATEFFKLSAIPVRARPLPELILGFPE